MKGRIKREDLDQLLRLVQSGLPETIARDAGEDDGRLSAAEGLFAPDQALWNANHAFWIEKLKSETGGTWTDAQCAAAATIINSAEYQHVIFSDIARALTRGLSESWRNCAPVGDDKLGFFSSKANRTEPSWFDETVELVDGSTGQGRQVRLAAVLEDVHERDQSDEHKVSSANAKGSAAGAVDAVLALRHVILGELTGCRARDAAPVSFNQARSELFAQCGLSSLLPYAGWDDFQDRNHLSDTLIADLKAAYPEGFAAVDLWVGGLAETAAVGALGPTIAATVRSKIAQVAEVRVPASLDLLAGTHLLSDISTQSLSDIVARNAADLAPGLLASADQASELGRSKIVIGTDGNDVLLGGAGDDFLDGRRGADVMVGGPGNDTYIVDDIGDRVIETVDGGVADAIQTVLKSFALDDPAPPADARVTMDTSSSLAPTYEAVGTSPAAPAPDEAPTKAIGDLSDFGKAANVENLTYIGDDNFTGIGNSSNNVISSGAGDDSLWGKGGDDVLYGNVGDDALFGDSGNDSLFGGDGNDRLEGGAGDDRLYGNRGDDALFGGSGNNSLFGGRGDDRFEGGAGDDRLYGGEGDDALFGGRGNNSLFGGDGDDRFEGGAGDDVLYISTSAPGYGNDTIVLKPGFGNDVVIGFDANQNCGKGHDRLDVSAYASLTADSIGAEIQITAMGPDTVITINGDSVTLLDVNANAIGKDAFIFS